MGIGVSRKVKLVVLSEQTGPDGIEPLSEEVANIWAEINSASQNRGFNDGKASYVTSYEFLIRYDSSIALNINTMIEYGNRFYSIQSIQRGDKVRSTSKFSFQFQDNPEGKYWRVIANSEDYG
jgi:hypothetical protein